MLLVSVVLSAVAAPAARAEPFPQAVSGERDRHPPSHRQASTASTSSTARPVRPGRRWCVLLHGFPTSSHMFRNLIPALADRYRVIAPDYPAFGHSAMPDRAHVRLQLRALRRADRRPPGPARRASATRSTCRTTVRRSATASRSSIPSASRALVVQNGNAYEEGLQEFWKPIKAYWADGSRRASRGPARGADAGGHEVPVPRRRARPVAHRARQLAARPGAARPARASTRSCSTCSRTTAATSRCIRSSRPSSARAGRRR